IDGPSIVTLTFSVSWSTSSSVQLTPSTPLSVESRSDISTRDGLWGFRTSKTIRLMSLNGLRLRETVSTGTFDNKRSLASPGRGLRAGGSHDHRVLGLRHDSAADVQQRRVRHHGPGAYEPIQQGGRVTVEAIRPPLRERKRLELPQENLQKVVRLGLFHRLRLEAPIDVAGPTAVDLARAGRGERFNRDDLAGVEGVVPVRDVRHTLAGVKQIPFDRVTGEVANRTKPMRLDCPLNPLAEGSRRHATVDGLDRRLECELGGTRESRPAARADLHGDRGVGGTPWLRIVARPPDKSTTVDSPPRGVGPPSTYRSTPSPSWPCASAQVTGEAEPWRFALVAVMGPYAFARSRGIGWAGTRRAIRRALEATAGGGGGGAPRKAGVGPGGVFFEESLACGVGPPIQGEVLSPPARIRSGC